MLVEKLRDDGPGPGVPNVCCRVESIDDHTVAEGGCVRNNDGVNVPNRTAADTPENLGGGIGLDVAGDGHEDQAWNLRPDVSRVKTLGKPGWCLGWGLTQGAEKMGKEVSFSTAPNVDNLGEGKLRDASDEASDDHAHCRQTMALER